MMHVHMQKANSQPMMHQILPLVIWNGKEVPGIKNMNTVKTQCSDIHFHGIRRDFLKENIHLTDSCIEIWARKDGTEGVLFSNFKIKYGIVKALVKLPDVEGAWSAFWLFRGMPELDIFEHCGQWKNQVSVTHHWGYSYEKGMKKSTLNNERYNESFKPTEQYYVYEVEVTPYEVIYRINGEVTRVMTEGIPSHEQHIILNVSTGDYCDDIPLKKDAVMKVKWIKVFEMP